MESPKLTIGIGPRVLSFGFRQFIRVKFRRRIRDLNVCIASACDDWEEMKGKWKFITVFPY